MSLPTRPMPQISEVARPYWDAAAQGRLVLQGCADCGKLRHYPRLLCDRCYSAAVRWHSASGRGRIHSWTVAHHAFHPAFAAELPYTLVTVDLEEGVRTLARWKGDATLVIGLPVRGGFVARDADGGIDLVFEPDRAD